jgi:cytochrome c oxidase subunit 2
MNDADFQLFPEAASTVAPVIDQLFWFLTILTIVLSTLIAGLIVYFSIKYRRASTADRTPYTPSMMLEMTWIVGPIPILLGIFFWSADLFFELRRPPADSMQVTVVAKQWMWKFQHPGGQREIDTLHVPVDTPVVLRMASQDVIHSLFIPALRIKQDVVPGRTETLSFTADRPGTWRLACAEFCGTDHSVMGGSFVTMTPEDYAAWLRTASTDMTLAEAGAALFRSRGCSGCHGAAATVHAPPLEGLYGGPVPLADGSVVTADEQYIRDSILLPQKQIAAGYPPIMPTFANQLSEDDVLQLTAYVKSLADAAPEARP